ncbi:hypothetical protein EV651_112183 [Kribbella sp. VKM Ac-2571]|uniref:hypothetical protein n=1 Tax=Kribbella sp. VKM Ac-2571 TaxID=2512222 RepID=UPI001061C4C1|nr:hypothetical protein [Kribbella sp. VKM Ac-2571]TDO56796.1 hypothetical protein EV651_112183 [Kribbella sp. VKM Ac-2571]
MWRLLAAGGACGLAWACGLRGFMAQVAGPGSTVTWSGTFGWILLPGAVLGALLGWSEYLRRTGGRRRRWLTFSPLLLAAVLLPGITDPAHFLADGIGGGALAVPLFGMAGGYAIAGSGRRSARIACTAVALLPIPGWLIAALAQGSAIGPREVWVALYFWSLLAVLSFASSIPHRRTTTDRLVSYQ